jgi:hypothetical protein
MFTPWLIRYCAPEVLHLFLFSSIVLHGPPGVEGKWIYYHGARSYQNFVRFPRLKQISSVLVLPSTIFKMAIQRLR